MQFKNRFVYLTVKKGSLTEYNTAAHSLLRLYGDVWFYRAYFTMNNMALSTAGMLLRRKCFYPFLSHKTEQTTNADGCYDNKCLISI